MSEEMKQETAQESQSNVAENKPESPSNDGLLSEVVYVGATIQDSVPGVVNVNSISLAAEYDFPNLLPQHATINLAPSGLCLG